jgi:hypothetical protein
MIGNRLNRSFPIFATWLLLVSSVRGEDEITIPVVNRPSEHFYDAAGYGITVRLEVTPKEVLANAWMTWKLTIKNVLNPKDVQAPDLSKIPDFHQKFEFKPFDPNETKIGVNECEFTYHARPRNEDIKAVPVLPFCYYNPRSDSDNPNITFPFTRTSEVPIKVIPIERAPPPIEPLQVHPIAMTIAKGEGLLSYTQKEVFPSWFTLFLVGAPILVLSLILLCRILYPNANRLAHRQQSRAAKRALRDLSQLPNLLDERIIATTVQIVLIYLQDRFGLVEWARTPIEIKESLGKMNLESEMIARTGSFFEDGDRARFSPFAVENETLLPKARELILEWEEKV